METSKVITSRRPILNIKSADRTTVICCVVCAIAPFVPDIIDKFIDFTTNVMQNGYALKFNAGSVSFSLERGSEGVVV